MTIGELIEELKKYPQDATVYLWHPGEDEPSEKVYIEVYCNDILLTVYPSPFD